MAVRNVDRLLDHYKQVAQHYDSFFEIQYNDLAEITIKEFALKPGDKLVDLGAGTGGVTHLIWKKAGLQSPVLAVDPSEDLLKIASSREGVSIMQATTEEFVDLPVAQEYNKFLFCRSSHHSFDQEGLFKKMYHVLPKGGQILVLESLEHLLWDEAKKLCRPVSLDQTEFFIQKAGFAVTKRKETLSYYWNKQKYFQGLRHRVFSVLELLSDEEIEKGIAELDRTFFKYADGGIIEIGHDLLKATKI